MQAEPPEAIASGGSFRSVSGAGLAIAPHHDGSHRDTDENQDQHDFHRSTSSQGLPAPFIPPLSRGGNDRARRTRLRRYATGSMKSIAT
jgi:hypothetical protein